jgi:PiT family inorganic phosphate transporter
MTMELLIFALVLALAYANGTNDVSKAIATLVGSGITNYRAAILWGTFWTMVGAGAAALVAGAMVKTFSQGLVQAGTSIPPIVAMAVLAGAMAWVLCASYTGLPVSTTHVSSSAIIGIGLRKGVRAVSWSTVRHMVLAWIVTLPATAFLAFLSYWILSAAF